MSILRRRDIRLMVCDMAGTVVQENGSVYIAIANALKEVGCKVDARDVKGWHGRGKDEVIASVISTHMPLGDRSCKYRQAMKLFDTELRTRYFINNEISLIDPDIPYFFNWLRNGGIKIGLDTGYSRPLQNDIIDHLNLGNCIDGNISTDDVSEGRPYPYMIYRLMEKTKTVDVKSVAKVGDTVVDMKQGKNAGCGTTFGVLSGAVTRNELLSSCHADYIVEKVTDIR